MDEYGRGAAGGLIFSVPLLFTMEVWSSGFLLNPSRLFIYLIATVFLLLVYNRFAGLRKDASVGEMAIDSVEELGMGLVLATSILWLSDRINNETGLHEMIGKIVMQSMMVAVGISVGKAQLGGDQKIDQGVDTKRDANDYTSQSALAMCGGLLFAANIAATEEVMVVGLGAGAARLLAIMAFSFLICTVVLHFADFRGAKDHVLSNTKLVRMRGVITTYAAALVASGLSLWFFGVFDDLPFRAGVACLIVVGLPASLGASAGRLLIQ